MRNISLNSTFFVNLNKFYINIKQKKVGKLNNFVLCTKKNKNKIKRRPKTELQLFVRCFDLTKWDFYFGNFAPNFSRVKQSVIFCLVIKIN